MSLETMHTAVEEYFSSMSPTAKRIVSDIAAIKDAYEDAWDTLSLDDQIQVLDETIIDPKAILKYSCDRQEDPSVQCFPKLKLQTGEKYVTDEENGKATGFSWRDEHSSPFSWETQSQLDLTLFAKPRNSTPKKSFPQVQLCPKKSPKVPPKVPPRSSQEEPTNIANDSSKSRTSTPKKSFPQVQLCSKKSPKVPPKVTPKPAQEEPFDPPNVVLGGNSNTQKLMAELDMKLKMSPQPSMHKAGDEGFLAKLRSKSAVLKIPLKSLSGGTGIVKDVEGEGENLVVKKGVSSPNPTAKAKSHVTKPKTPPPPPPVKLQKGPPAEPPVMQSVPSKDTEQDKRALLAGSPEETDGKSLASGEEGEETGQEQLRLSGLLEELNELKIDISGPSEAIPKTGFEFLDNW